MKRILPMNLCADRKKKKNFRSLILKILNEVQINKDVVFNSALFLIIGSGYFDYDASWADSNYFRLTNANGFNTTTNPGNAIIRAMVENKQWGWIPRLSIKHTNGELITGAEGKNTSISSLGQY